MVGPVCFGSIVFLFGLLMMVLISDKPWRVQFSMKYLLTLITAIGVCCAAWQHASEQFEAGRKQGQGEATSQNATSMLYLGTAMEDARGKVHEYESLVKLLQRNLHLREQRIAELEGTARRPLADPPVAQDGYEHYGNE